MSVKKLKLTDTLGSKLKVKFENNELVLEFEQPDDNAAWLDRNQAHLLYLYLKEHLNV